MSVDRSLAFRFFLMLTTVLCGAIVMVIEVLGSRVIGPFFGVSLFVWTALITVTLLSLSVGYALGGVLADRKPSPAWLYGIIVASGVLVLLVPILKAPVIQALAPIGLRSGALLSAAVLFGPALLLLGCVSPYVVRVAASEWGRLGRTVGILYALSTIGSMLGTALAGYVVIAYIGVARAFQLCGGLLVLLGLSYFLIFRRQIASAIGGLVVVVLVWPVNQQLPAATQPDGTQVRLVAAQDSFYGNVKVVDYSGRDGSIREMLIDGMVQGGVDQRTGQSVYEYPYLLDELPFGIKPDIRSALVVGVGAGVVPERLRLRGIEVDSVDIDPTVVSMAEKYFAIKPARPVVTEDARMYLARDGVRFDLIVLDAFSGDATPVHLLSREALARIRARLAPDGVVAINLIGDHGMASRLLITVVRTLYSEFSHVAAFPLSRPGEIGGNVILLVANRPIDGAMSARIETVHPLARQMVDSALRDGKLLVRPGEGVILTDDYNPLDVLDLEMREHVRRGILESTPPAILLYG